MQAGLSSFEAKRIRKASEQMSWQFLNDSVLIKKLDTSETSKQ